MVFQEFLPVSENSWPLQSLTVAKDWLSEIKPITVKAYGRGWNFYFHLSDFTFQFIQSSEWERRVRTLSLSNPPSQHKCISDWYCPSTGSDARAWSSLLPCLVSTVLLSPPRHGLSRRIVSAVISDLLLLTKFCAGWFGDMNISRFIGELWSVWASHNPYVCSKAVLDSPLIESPQPWPRSPPHLLSRDSVYSLCYTCHNELSYPAYFTVKLPTGGPKRWAPWNLQHCLFWSPLSPLS